MMRLSIAGAFSAVILAAACARPEQSAADTATASSTAAGAATIPVDTMATSTESTTSVSRVTHSSSVKKRSGSAARKTGSANSVRSTEPTAQDSILGRDSVIRFPIRRLPTASSSPVKR